jgi:MGT family glycosyltransferase
VVEQDYDHGHRSMVHGPLQKISNKKVYMNINEFQPASIKPGTKILFANVPADGHFNPLTGLAVYLKNKGCDVRWYTSHTYRNKIEKMNIPFYGLKKAVDISANVDIETIFPERKKYKSQVSKLKFDMINAFILRGTEYYEDITGIYNDFPFEVMVADITFAAIPFVKENMNIPVVAISVVPLPETSRDLPPSGLGLTPSDTLFGKLKQKALRFIADTLIFAKPTRVMKKILASYNIDAGNANIFDILIRKSSVVLQSGTPGFEYKRSDMSRHVHFIGPLLPWSENKNTPAWYHEKLNKYKTIVLVTQGTVEKDIEKLLVPTLHAFMNTDILVIATTGGTKTEELRKQFASDNYIIEDFIPFDDVMPYADVYVTNGGYGGVLFSIKNELPMVVAGIHEGKNEINARVGFFSLGINLKTEKPSAEQVRINVEKVLADPQYVRNVKSLSYEFSQYHPGALCEKYLTEILPVRKRSRQAAADYNYIY